MDRGDIIAALIGAVVLIAAVIYVLYAKIRTSERRETEYLVTDYSDPRSAPQTDKPFSSPTIEEIHRKYDQMAETDPIAAGRMKYAELLKHHGE